MALAGELPLYYRGDLQRVPMNKRRRQLALTIVDFLVAVAVLMILAALVVPMIFPPSPRTRPADRTLPGTQLPAQR
jgi:hypothetical protein